MRQCASKKRTKRITNNNKHTVRYAVAAAIAVAWKVERYEYYHFNNRNTQRIREKQRRNKNEPGEVYYNRCRPFGGACGTIYTAFVLCSPGISRALLFHKTGEKAHLWEINLSKCIDKWYAMLSWHIWLVCCFFIWSKWNRCDVGNVNVCSVFFFWRETLYVGYIYIWDVLCDV